MTRFGRSMSRIWCITALVGWLTPAGAQTEGSATTGRPIQPGEVQAGTLLVAGGGGILTVAPTLETDVAISVSGAIVRARVTQRFLNPTDQWMEGVYIFPLPDTAAVDHLLMLVGPRIIEGQIHEREQAKQIYSEAKAQGRKASLVEQQRPNVFTSSVANIGPNETVEIMLEYQDTVPFDGVQYALRFPLVVAPRYLAGQADEHALGCPVADLSAEDSFQPAADVINPPQAWEPVNPVTLTVELDPGFALAFLYSPSHEIVSEPIGPFVQLVSLASDAVPADRDFELLWAPALGAAPRATLLAEEHGDEVYALLTVLPPAPHVPAARIPRETVFIVDTSGSMAGQSMDQAKLALLLALDGLAAGDRFNVIQFNSVTEMLFTSSVPADPPHLQEARDWVDGLSATGGTEMAPALAAALAEAAPPGLVRQIVFMTDGAVGNEAELFRYIAAHLGDSRLFTVGIGSAPNAFFMRKAAQFGRGTFTYIGSPTEVSARMDELFRKLERPALADVAVDWQGLDDEALPDPLPDLYTGQPLVLAVRLHDLPETVTVTGRVGTTPWRVVIHRPPLDYDGAGIRQLWARRKIEALMDGTVAGADREAVRNSVIAVALEHHLVSAYTSLVAVDVTPTAPHDATLLTRNLPVNAPHGSLRLPNTATPASLYSAIAAALLLLSLLIARRHTVR